jgi:hypothetical protein
MAAGKLDMFETIINASYLCLYYSYKLNVNGFPRIFNYTQLRLASSTLSDSGRHPEPNMTATKTGSGNNT